MNKVAIRHTETGAEGTAPVRAVPYWLERGYEVVDPEAYDQAKTAAGVTADAEARVVEAAAGEPGSFNPTASKADEVHQYLGGLDRSTDAGQAEFDRVVAAERAGHNDGKGRATALAGF